ncbi:MAG: polysaccharide biosynthesis tyrosine autokinase [Planctomycetota bacterium]
MDIIPTFDKVPQPERPRRTPRAHPPGQPFIAGPAEGGLNAKDVLRILRKRFWMAVFVWLTVTAVICAITLVWWLFAPSYRAAAIIEVKPPSEQLTGTLRLYGKDIMDRIMLSHAQIIKSEPVLRKAADNKDVKSTAWYRKDEKDPEKVLKNLNEDISVRAVPNTNYIEISMTGSAPTESEKVELATIVNAVAQAFVTESRSTVRGERLEDIGELNEQLETHKKELNLANREAELAREASDMPNLQERKGVLTNQLMLLHNQLSALNIERAQLGADRDALKEQVADGTIAKSPLVLQALDMDPTYRALRGTEINLVSEIDRLSRNFGPKHRDMGNLNARLESVRREIDTKEKELTDQAAALLINSTEMALGEVVAKLLRVQKDLEEVYAKATDVQNTLVQLEETFARKEKLEERIRGLEDRIMEIQLLERGEQQVLLRVPAAAPREISAPKWVVMVPLGVVLGLGLGVGLAFLLEFIDTSIKGPSDISRRVDLPLLGTVPHTDDVDEKIEDIRLAFVTNPNSLVCEAFRQIRTCLLFSGPESQRRSLLITSPLPEDGRTTVAMNLAASIARDGRKVLVVDANFRQPAVRQLFGECPEGGLSSALVGQGNWRDSVHKVEPNLHVLPAGTMPPNPAELLGSEEMRKLIAEMVEQYEQVFIDSAPVLVVTDSCVLSTLVDGVILVVRAGENTYGIIQRTRDMLLRVGTHFVGVVLNGVRVTAGGYLRESYETYYDYHEPMRLPGA